MTRVVWVSAMVALALCVSAVRVNAGTIRGTVADESGKAMHGVMVSAFDEERQVSTSVFSQEDGSFTIDGLRDAKYNIRARLMGVLDEWTEDIGSGADDVKFSMVAAEGEDLEDQRTADFAIGMLAWDNKTDKENFKMMCSTCHQIGSKGWRSPEEPVDWETMIKRMDGWGGLYKHTQETLIERIVETFSPEAVAKWPPFVPPPAPTGMAARAKITEWDMGEQFKVMIHDMEPGSDGLVYMVDMAKNACVSLNPETGERLVYRFPGKYRGPHSVERGNDGNMWFTLCGSGEMAMFDVKSKEFTITSSAVAPKKRGLYPHTLRINPEDPEGLVWYTDCGMNSCFSLHPKSLHVTEYKLLQQDQAVGYVAGRGEAASGITLYGIDYSPYDGSIWYTKLGANRIGRIDPTVEGGDIKEWAPPFRGPRRHHVAPNGHVWVPGFGSGVIGAFDPKTEEWKVYDLPNGSNQIPYALNVDKDGIVWVCGTNNDAIVRFDPETEEFVTFRMPTRVTFTRELEFDEEGNVWTSNANSPARHTERGLGSIIKLEILKETVKVARRAD